MKGENYKLTLKWYNIYYTGGWSPECGVSISSGLKATKAITSAA